MKKWYTYQKERFPLIQYIPLMFAFGFSSVSFSLHLHNPGGRLSDITIPQYLAAMLTTLFWFMLMRIADEHKDFAEDAAYRPYRPVPRGLITLKELRVVGILLVLAQIALSIWVDWRLLIPLAIVYAWFTLMTLEFGVAKWLKARPTLYLASHMLILPFIDFYATAIEWLPRGGAFSVGILLYMISGYCDGTVVEVGRKLRAKEDEEYGVDTYTQIWGPKRAMAVWMFCMTISIVTTTLAGFRVNVGWVILAVLLPLYVWAAYAAARFAKVPTSKNAKFFEIFPGIWLILMYIMLGVLPFFVGGR